jgi:transcriptional regulator with XRE-family HTH domain
MPDTTVDVEVLYAALDRKRQMVWWSWRELARGLGIRPSTLTRMAQGRPDVDTLATLLRWLGMPADAFMRTALKKRAEPDTVAVISSYLRADSWLAAEDAEAIGDFVEAAFRRLSRANRIETH